MFNPLDEIILKKCIRECLEETGIITTINDDLITIDEVSQLTKLARQTLYAKCSAGKIPFIKRPNSKKLLFSRQAIMTWLKGEEGKK